MYIWTAILCFAWAHLTSSSPLNRLLPILPHSPISTNLTSSPKPLTWAVNPINLIARPDISLPTPLSEDATFINIVHAIKDLAHGDILGQIPAQDFKTERYPDPLIRLTSPVGSETLKREHVIWGLHGAFLGMYGNLGFSVSHFTLLLDGVEVGGIGFGDPFREVQRRELGYRSLDPDSEMSITKPTIPASTPPPNNLTSLAARLTLSFTPFSRPIPKPDLFISIIWTLALAAVPASNQRIPHLWLPIGQESNNCRYTVSATVRTSTPWLQFFWVVEALSRTADWAVEMGLYRMVRGVLRVDGVEVGREMLVGKG
ncbi:MAG: hypothetical protein Q9176_006980 [Flavoplaca citrina]